MNPIPIDMWIAAAAMVPIDYVYLQAIKNYFQWQVATVQKTPMKVNLWGAALCYLFLVVGIYYFIIRDKRSYWDAFLLGLVIYGVFETTNYALFKDWSFITVILDTLWGGILFALTTYVVYSYKKLKNIFNQGLYA